MCIRDRVGVADDVVDRAAAVDSAGVVLAVHVQRRPGDQDLRAGAPGDLTEPGALFGVDGAQQPRVDTDDPHRPGVHGPVGARLDGLLGRCGPQRPGLVETFTVVRARAVPQQGPQPGPGEGAGRGFRFEGRGVVAEDAHEGAEVLVPVVVAGYRVDRGAVVLVRAEELRAVVVRAAHRVDHVTGHDREAGVLTRLQKAGHDGVLGVVALARVADDHEGEAVRVVTADHLVGGLARGRPLRHPPAAGAARGVAEPGRHDAVAGGPQRPRVQPGALLDPLRQELPVRAAFGGAPAGAFGGIT